ncbi:MAG: DNA primase family protein [Vicinamibacterales bacterium]
MSAEARSRLCRGDLELPRLTDLGNAQRLVWDHGRDLHYIHAWGAWLIYDGRRWAQDETGEVQRRAKATVVGMYAGAAYSEDIETRRTLARHATKSESARALTAMVTLAQSEPGIPVTLKELDADPWLLNVLNGTLDLRTAQLREHRREDLLTKLTPVEYLPEAACPTFLAFLDRVMEGKQDLVCFWQKWMGYSLTGDTSEQAIVIAWGNGANGKTTLIVTTAHALDDYARSTPVETLLAKNGDTEVRHDLARLLGARFVAAVESDAGRRLSESLVKQITGGDRIIARSLYRDSFEFAPTFKLVLATNHRPVIRGTDHAIWRRIRLLPFAVTIPPEEQDRQLPDKLRAELPGILRWAVEGCLAWQRDGLGLPEAVRDATEAYREDMDTLGEFLGTRCVIEPGARTTSGALYRAYTAWCQQADERPVSQKALGRALTERGAKSIRTGSWRGWIGIQLRSTEDETPEWMTQ